MFQGIIDDFRVEFKVSRDTALENGVSEGHIRVKEGLHLSIAATVLQLVFFELRYR